MNEREKNVTKTFASRTEELHLVKEVDIVLPSVIDSVDTSSMYIMMT